jgi:hypothetical protein
MPTCTCYRQPTLHQETWRVYLRQAIYATTWLLIQLNDWRGGRALKMFPHFLNVSISNLKDNGLTCCSVWKCSGIMFVKQVLTPHWLSSNVDLYTLMHFVNDQQWIFLLLKNLLKQRTVSSAGSVRCCLIFKMRTVCQFLYHFSCFENIKGGLWDHLVVCVPCLPPPTPTVVKPEETAVARQNTFPLQRIHKQQKKNYWT